MALLPRRSLSSSSQRSLKRNFCEISYGSLNESKYLLHFSLVEKYLDAKDYKKTIDLSEEIGAMLWKSIQSIKE